jgi:dynein assembly factor 3
MGDDGLGVHQFWGSTPAIDICAESRVNGVCSGGSQSQQDNELHILVASTADLRHVMRTMSSKQNRKEHKMLHFYVYDNPMEVMARHLLLLHIMMQVRNSFVVDE